VFFSLDFSWLELESELLVSLCYLWGPWGTTVNVSSWLRLLI